MLGLIEPTIREGFVKRLDSINIDKNLFNNKIFYDVYNKKINSDFLYEMKSDLGLIKEIIINDKDYNNLKNKMIGFKNRINEKEKMINKNIDLIYEFFKIDNKLNNKVSNLFFRPLNNSRKLKNFFIDKYNFK